MDRNPHEEQLLSTTEGDLPEVVRQQGLQGWAVVALTTNPLDGKITILLTRPIRKE